MNAKRCVQGIGEEMMAPQADRMGGYLGLGEMTRGNFISNQSDNLPFQHRLITSLLTRFLTEQDKTKLVFYFTFPEV